MSIFVTLLVFISCSFVVAVSILLVVHPEYRISPPGVAGLALLSGGAGIRAFDIIADIFEGDFGAAMPHPRAIIAWVGSALFLLHIVWEAFFAKKWADYMWHIGKGRTGEEE